LTSGEKAGKYFPATGLVNETLDKRDDRWRTETDGRSQHREHQVLSRVCRTGNERKTREHETENRGKR